MTDRVYKKVELVGTSAVGVEDAVRSAVAKGAESIGPVDWFEVSEVRGKVAGGAVEAFQVTVTLGVRLES